RRRTSAGLVRAAMSCCDVVLRCRAAMSCCGARRVARAALAQASEPAAAARRAGRAGAGAGTAGAARAAARAARAAAGTARHLAGAARHLAGAARHLAGVGSGARRSDARLVLHHPASLAHPLRALDALGPRALGAGALGAFEPLIALLLLELLLLLRARLHALGAPLRQRALRALRLLALFGALCLGAGRPRRRAPAL